MVPVPLAHPSTCNGQNTSAFKHPSRSRPSKPSISRFDRPARPDEAKSFDEFLEKCFPESRRKAYYLMAIHEHLPKQARKQLKLVGWSKASELVKVARSEGERFDCATWVHKARSLPKETFKREVDRYLTGKDTEPWEIIYFKLYKSQLTVVERALETAALMLGSDKSRGYSLEMICADFVAGYPHRGYGSGCAAMEMGSTQ